MFNTAPKRWLLGLTILWMVTIMCLGIWWLFLLVKLSHLLEQSHLSVGVNFVSLVKWEGLTFLVMLILISSTLFYLYFQELKQTNSLKAFFASLTHELKTPLASMRLQAEVMHDLIENNNNLDSIHDYAHRLIDDGKRLELEMDKILHLSRVERGGRLNLVEIDLARYTKMLVQKHEPETKVEWQQFDTPHTILADEFALSLILRNLLDNSRKHAEQLQMSFKLKQDDKTISLQYSDGGKFTGDIQQLGTLFYKHNSPKGSGIGLYLIKQLMGQMQGQFTVLQSSPLTFELKFQKGEAHA